MLHGHGVRARMLVGPTRSDSAPRVHDLLARRYRCQGCGAVVLVVPQGVLPRLRYTAFAVVTALALWGLGRTSSASARDVVSPWSSSGDERFHGWRSLTRWARAGPPLWPGLYVDESAKPRLRALSIVTQLSARAPTPTGDLLADALSGLRFS